MTVTSITVSSQLKRPRLSEDFATDSVMISLTAEVQEGEDTQACALQMQKHADDLAIRHMEDLRSRYAQRTREVLDYTVSERARAATARKTADLAAKHAGGAF